MNLRLWKRLALSLKTRMTEINGAVPAPAARATVPGLMLGDDEFELFRRWIYDAAGIRLADGKRALVAGRLSKRLRTLNLNSYRHYFEQVTQGGPEGRENSERQIALDLLTTNETFFFREQAHFDYVEKELCPRWGNRSVRCWSAASSSGEEAYTLAMVLAEHYAGDWRITGTDISSRVVDKAQQAIYPMMRSKNIPRRYLQEYCRKGIGSKTDTFRMAPSLRERVTFSCANLQQPQPGLGQFDLIFLRNVMIYFDAASKQQVVSHLLDRLKPGGFLFIGHAESLNGVTQQLKLVRPSVYQCEAEA